MSANLKMLKKIRGRLLYRTSGAPVAGVVVTLSITFGENSVAPISTLKSDATGYFSFDLQPLIQAGLDNVTALLISAPQVGLRDYNLLRKLLASSTDNQTTFALFNNSESNTSLGQKPLCIEFPIFVERLQCL